MCPSTEEVNTQSATVRSQWGRCSSHWSGGPAHLPPSLLFTALINYAPNPIKEKRGRIKVDSRLRDTRLAACPVCSIEAKQRYKYLLRKWAWVDQRKGKQKIYRALENYSIIFYCLFLPLASFPLLHKEKIKKEICVIKKMSCF